MTVLDKKIGTLVRDLFSMELKKKLCDYHDIFFLNYRNLKSAEMTQLRKNLKNTGSAMLVAKNSFMKRVLEDAKKPKQALTMVDGPTALVFVKDDPVVTSKVLVDFAKEHEALKIQGGFLEERHISLEDIKHISKLPSIQAVYQQIASVLNAPINKLAMSLNQTIAKIAYALKAVSENKGKNSSS